MVRRLPMTNSRTCDLTPAAGRRQLDRGIERHEVGQAVGGGRGIAEIAGQGPTVLDLDTTDRAGRRLQSVERGRELGADDISPRRERRDPDKAVVGHRDLAQRRQPRDVEDVVRDRMTDVRRIDVGATGEHRPWPIGERGERVIEAWSDAGNRP
jgi:hypothetical protein